MTSAYSTQAPGGRSFNLAVSATNFGRTVGAFDGDVFDAIAFDGSTFVADVILRVSASNYSASVSASAFSIEVSVRFNNRTQAERDAICTSIGAAPGCNCQ